jgi:hypothetical protein
VRQTTSWPRSWANFSLFTAVFPQDYTQGPACNVWANLTAFSLECAQRFSSCFLFRSPSTCFTV